MKLLLFIVSILCSSVLFAQSPVLLLNDDLIASDLPASQNFKLNKGIILVEAEVDGRTGTFILDTGAPGVVLNQNPRSSTQATSGLHKPTPAENIVLKEFSWQGETHKNIPGLRIDLSHLEAKTSTPLGGLLGYGLLKDRELEIDYPRQQIRLNDGKTRHRNPLSSTPFRLVGHAPVVRIQLNGKTYHFLIDTGASINVLDEKLVEKLADQFSETHRTKTIYGVDRTPLKTKTGTLRDVRLNKHAAGRDLTVHLTDLDFLREQFQHPIDGILGYPFFAERHVVINYGKRRIYFLK